MSFFKFLIRFVFAAIILNVVLSNVSHPPRATTMKWAIEKSSTLKVTGKSNVNEFTCEIPGYYETDTILLANDGISREVKLKGSLDIDVFKFDCHNSMITKDFRKTLTAKKYPNLKIRFVSLEQLPTFQNTTQVINGNVEITLAGVQKTFTIPFQFVKNSLSTLLLNGTKIFRFSDFKLIPPKKLLGTIKVKDEFTVEFRLKLNVVK